jgi:multisubunit Na+/H+ antiporter MnhE subunit
MDFSVSTLLAGLLFGAIGLWLIRSGRREGNLRWAALGLVMLVYPYFSPNAWVDWGLGAALCGLAYLTAEA